MTDITGYRIARLRQRMSDTGTDLVAVGPSSHMQWLLGLNPHGDERPVMALVTVDQVGVLMPKLNAEAARAQCSDIPFYEWCDSDGPQGALTTLLTKLDINRPGLNVVIDEMMRADFAFFLLDQFEAPVRQFTKDTVGILRAEKDAEEHQLLRECARLNDTAFELAFASLRTGMSENDVKTILVDHYRAHGAEPEFCIVGFGANSAFPHHHTGTDVLQPEMAVLIDSGCRLNGYPSDMTRCAWYGDRPDPKFTQTAGIVETALQAALTVVKPGMACCEVDEAARGVIEAAGFGAAFPHRTGHGLGVDVHEPPYITASNNQRLTVGNVFSIEPGIYLTDSFGIRLEDIVHLGPIGPEILSGLARSVLQIAPR